MIFYRAYRLLSFLFNTLILLMVAFSVYNISIGRHGMEVYAYFLLVASVFFSLYFVWHTSPLYRKRPKQRDIIDADLYVNQDNLKGFRLDYLSGGVNIATSLWIIWMTIDFVQKMGVDAFSDRLFFQYYAVVSFITFYGLLQIFYTIGSLYKMRENRRLSA